MPSNAKRLGLEIQDDLESELRFRRIEQRLGTLSGAGDLDADGATTRATDVPQVKGFRVVGSTPGAITLAWNAVQISDLRRYELDIAEDIGFSVNKQTFFVAGTQFQFSTVSASGGGGGTVIFARVRARNKIGKTGPYSVTLNTATGQAQTEDIGEGEVTTENIDQVTLEGITLVATDTVHEFNPTTRLIFNPNHFYLAGDNAGGDDPIVNLNLGLQRHTSGLLSLPAAGATRIFAHGHNGIPDFVHVYLVNVVSDLNYAVGDRIPVTADAFGQSGGQRANFTVYIDVTNIGFVYGADGITISDKTTGASSMITAARWRLLFSAYKEV